MKISLAPLQGYTEFPFRNALAETIGGIDKYYTPYLRLENDRSLRSKFINDIKPENNAGIDVVPQILVNSSDQFLSLANIIEEHGFSEINWNLGCPYPMVAKRKLGSGLLPYPDMIKSVLDAAIPKTILPISIKLRSGYEDSDEIFRVIELLNQYPLKLIIYHPRIGKQLYKGSANIEKFIQVQKLCKIPMAYNGDIDSLEKYNDLLKISEKVNHIMIGRGLLKNIFLAFEIKGEKLKEEHKRQYFNLFHKKLLTHYKYALSGDTHLLNKMVHFWEYFSFLFIDQRKVYKSLKKAKNIVEFENKVSDIMKASELLSS